MTSNSFTGVYSALLTPRCEAGDLDESAFLQLLEFQGKHGISQFALNGATGEFCVSKPNEVRRLCALVRTHVGAQAALLPAPYFFPYEQDDVAAWFRELAAASPLPVLLYNLPQFSTEIEIDTALELLRASENVIGVKDSSGSTAMLEAITRERLPVARIIGNDGALIAARRSGVCDAVISGVACVLPDLISAVFRNAEDEASCDRLTRVLAELAAFPTPWGLKWMAEGRGLMRATFAQPLAARRRVQGEKMMGVQF